MRCKQYHPTDLLRYFLVVDGFLSDSEVCNICISANVSQCSTKKSKASVVAFQRTDANPDGSAGRNNFEGFNTKRVYSVVGKTRALDKMIAHPVVMGLLHQWLLPNYLLTAAQVAWSWHEEAEFFQY